MDDIQVDEFGKQLLSRLDNEKPPADLDILPGTFTRHARIAQKRRTARILSVATLSGVAVIAAVVLAPSILPGDSVTTGEPAATSTATTAATRLAPFRTEVAAPPAPAWVLEPFAALSRGVEADPDALTAVRYDATTDSLVVLATDAIAAHALIDDVAPDHDILGRVEVEVVQFSLSDLELMMQQALESGEVAGQEVTFGVIDASRVKFGIGLKNATDEARAVLASRYGDAVEVAEGEPTLQPGP